MNAINQPLFILGPGRSGTTLLLNMLAMHPALGWFSGWTNRVPGLPQLAFLSRIQNYSTIERITRNRRKWPRPGETYRIWDRCFPGFSNASYDWSAADAHDAGRQRLHRLIQSHLKWQGKARFLTKYTGWPRIQFIRTLFPDAFLLYLDRDPRAVVFSYMKQRWWYRNHPQEYEQMTTLQRLEFYSKKYLAFYQAKKKYVAGRDYIQISYEAVVNSPQQSFEDLARIVGLETNQEFQRRISSWEIRTGTEKSWQTQLSEVELRCLNAQLADPVEEMGYRT
jgi:hypothetical protein